MNPVLPERRIQRSIAKSRSPLAPLLFLAARIPQLRSMATRLVCKLEGGQMWSQSFRDLMLRWYNVAIGQHTYFADLHPGELPPGTRFGNFCSIGAGLSVFRRNHPHWRLSQHPFFFNSDTGFLEEDSIDDIADNPLLVEHGVWIGANVTVTPRCHKIGYGAVVGTRSVVTRDVPPFMIVGGNPAKPIGPRFSTEVQDVLLETQWWTTPIEQLIPVLPLFLNDATLENAIKLRDHLRGVRPQPSSAAIVPLQQYGT